MFFSHFNWNALPHVESCNCPNLQVPAHLGTHCRLCSELFFFLAFESIVLAFTTCTRAESNVSIIFSVQIQCFGHITRIMQRSGVEGPITNTVEVILMMDMLLQLVWEDMWCTHISDRERLLCVCTRS